MTRPRNDSTHETQNHQSPQCGLSPMHILARKVRSILASPLRSQDRHYLRPSPDRALSDPSHPTDPFDSPLFSPQRRIRFYAGNVPCPVPAKHDTRTFSDCIRPGPYRRSQRLTGRTPGRASVYNSTQFYPWLPDEKSPTVINLESRHDNYAAAQMPDGRWRQLEWQELARLQGFPEDYVFIGSPGRVGKQVAQAVQIDTARAILRALVASLQTQD